MVVASGSFVTSGAQPAAYGFDASRSRCVEPREDRSQCCTTGTHHKEAVHETADGESSGRRGTGEGLGHFSHGALDIVNGQCRAPFGVAMKTPCRVMKGRNFQPFVESS